MGLYSEDELSVDNANPVELYLFTYDGANYCYTSSLYAITQYIDGQQYSFVPDYIKRSDSLRLGDSSGTSENCIITVNRTNNVALLFQGAPPEQGSIKVEVWRQHGESVSNANIIRLLRGVVSQVRFNGSEAELVITIENLLRREIPRGRLSYFCQNIIYDNKCALSENAYKLNCRMDEDTLDDLYIKADDLLSVEDGYFTDGFMVMGNCYRQIKEHKGDTIRIKYPIPQYARQRNFYVLPGCNNLFIECHEKFNNTDRFSGVCYQQPYDAFKHPVVKGAYWVSSIAPYYSNIIRKPRELLESLNLQYYIVNMVISSQALNKRRFNDYPLWSRQQALPKREATNIYWLMI